MSGPHKAGQNDKVIFNKPKGLKETLHQRGIKAIADKGYMGFKHQISNYNPYDSDEVKKFKSRALMRHESFNNLIKQFAILDTCFRSPDPQKIATTFEAVAVICQYRIELECPLYDV
jgi:hypothetical protein